MSGEGGQRVLKPIVDMVNERPNEDRTSQFDALWEVLKEMHQRIGARFELQRDPCCESLIDYETPGGIRGSLEVGTGPEIDWYVHSWCGHPQQTFSNMHITITLGPQYLVPNFGFALGTVPDLFMYMDFLPRLELVHDIDYADKYYAEANEEFLSMEENPNFRTFVSRDFYTRCALTPGALCYAADPDEANITVARDMALTRLDRWLSWVDAADKSPVDMRPAIAARDHQVRRNICERDPANVVAENIYGKEVAATMVKTLSAANRTLPRPTGGY